MTDHILIAEEMIVALETIVRPRCDAANERMGSGDLNFTAAYLSNRFDELGARPTVIYDTTKHSREHIYYILKGQRPMSKKAAAAISETYPDITLAELMAVMAITQIEEVRE